MLPKTTPGMPDSYGITVAYVTGKTVDYQVVFHTWVAPSESPGALALTLRTTDDELFVVERTSTICIKFDRNWVKIVEMRERLNESKAS